MSLFTLLFFLIVENETALLVCWGDGDIPAFLELGDGNQSDKKEFAQLLIKFKEQWQFEGL